jgi:hypothetical protein
MAKLLSGYVAGSGGVVNWTDPENPGYGKPYLVLTGPGNGLKWTDTTSGNTHTVSMAIPWENIATFRQYMLYSVVVSGGVSVQSIPCQSPFIGQFPNTYCTQITAQTDGQDANVSATRLSTDILLEVTFSTLTWVPSTSSPFLEVSYAGSADYDTVPDSAMSFVSSGEKIDHDAGVMVGQVAIDITFYAIANVVSWIGTVNALKSKVNSASITIDGVSYAAGYLFFPTYDLQKSVDSNGNITGTATVHFIQRDIPWNMGITSAGVVDAITPAPYQTADLNGVLSA